MKRKTKTHIAILRQLELTPVESKLLEVNLKLLSCKIPIVKKAGTDGIDSLITLVHYRHIVINSMKFIA